MLAVLFMVGAMALAIIGQRGPGVGRERRGAGPAARRLEHRRHPLRAPTTRRRLLRRRRSKIDIPQSLRKWRNWQTHQLEGLAVAIPWGFESPLPHHLKNKGLIAQFSR